MATLYKNLSLLLLLFVNFSFSQSAAITIDGVFDVLLLVSYNLVLLYKTLKRFHNSETLPVI